MAGIVLPGATSFDNVAGIVYQALHRLTTCWELCVRPYVEELEAMGFGRNRAVRALYNTGATSVEMCVNWIVEHETDKVGFNGAALNPGRVWVCACVIV